MQRDHSAFKIHFSHAAWRRAFEAVMARIRVPRGGLGRPRTRPEVVLAGRAYSSRAIRRHLPRRGIRAVIPQPSDQVGHRRRRGRSGGRPPSFDAQAQYRRAVPQPPQAVARPGHANRQTRHRLRGRTPPRIHLDLDAPWGGLRTAARQEPDSGPGRGAYCPHPAVRAPPGSLRNEQMPIDRHLAPRDATERRLIRQCVLQDRAVCFQACREARRSESKRESEGPEAVTELRHATTLARGPINVKSKRQA